MLQSYNCSSVCSHSGKSKDDKAFHNQPVQPSFWTLSKRKLISRHLGHTCHPSGKVVISCKSAVRHCLFVLLSNLLFCVCPKWPLSKASPCLANTSYILDVMKRGTHALLHKLMHECMSTSFHNIQYHQILFNDIQYHQILFNTIISHFNPM